ncbi:MAG TPA: hypothetical protein VIF62_09550 [Labilithrix sp.]
MNGRSCVVFAAAALVLASCVFATDFGAFTSGDDAGSDGAIDAPSPAPPAPVDGASDTGVDAPPLGPLAWRQAATTGPPPRHSMRLAYDDARGVTWLYGGWQDQSASASAELWSWNGSAWSGPLTPQGPSARHGGILAYDSAHQVLVLFGGLGSPGPSDTWQWDATRWLQPTTPTPPTVTQTTGAYDAERGAVVLFGGHVDNVGYIAETWEWNGTVWNQQSPAMPPPARAGHAMAYDVDRKKVVLFGGHDTTNQYDDTWEYDGAWAPKTTSKLVVSARQGACMAYHAARHVTVLFGGVAVGVAQSDTWLWDGTSWTPGPVGPPARFACSMAYDATRRAVVLFGGATRYVDQTHRDVTGDTWVLE